MPNRFSLKILRVLFFVLGLLGIPGAAQAGFQWVAPSAPPVEAPAAPPSSSVSAPSVESMPMPQPMSQATGKPEMLEPPAEDFMPPPPPTIIEAPTRATASPPHALGTMPSEAVVHGFANHVPLAVALREILPAGYGFSIDPSVDLGVLVSFQGGKPWRDTLKETLEPAGLVMHEQAQMVTIGYPAPTQAANVAPAVNEPSMAKPRPENASHFLTLPPEMVPGPSPASPPVVISGTQGASISGGAGSRSVVESWDAERGDSLRKILERWSRRADVEINWMAEYDYPLEASVHFTGTFEDAVRNLLTGFEAAHPQPVAELHSNSKIGETVLVVTTRGNVGE